MGQGNSKADLADILLTLSQTDVSPEAHDFWDELWKLQTTPDDIFELIPPEDVRKLKRERPENVVTLFTQAVAQLCQIVHTPVPVYFGQALNCVRVLTRVLPFLLEDRGKDDFSERLCWSIDDGTVSSSSENGGRGGDDDDHDASSSDPQSHPNDDDDDDAPQPLARLIVHAALHLLFLPGFTVDAAAFDDDDDDDQTTDEVAVSLVSEASSKPVASRRDDDDDETGTTPPPADEASSKSSSKAETSGDAVSAPQDSDDVRAAPPQTVASSFPGPASFPAAALWAPGLGSPDDASRPATSASFDRHRVEVIRLLLAALCEPLYQTADEYDPWASRWLKAATARDAPNARLLFYSLCNVIFSYDPTGFGVPYGGALFSSEAPTHLLNASTQLLVALLDFGTTTTTTAPGGVPPAADERLGGVPESEASSRRGGASPAPNEEETQKNHVANVYRLLLAELDGAKAFEFCFDGFARLLDNVHESANTTLPGSLAQIECYQEILVLLWKFLEDNDKFMPYILRHCDATRLVVPICFLQYQSRRDPAKVGLVHVCTFLLLKLSGERPFCVALNKPFSTRLPLDLPLLPDGSHADLIFVTLHKLVVNGGEKLAPLYNCFLTIMCNLSPYAKSLSLVTAVKLVNLFELFTSPRFLYQNPSNHVYVALLLEIFNNVVQYQYGGNPHLIYAVVRRKKLFDDLDNLTLPTAIARSKGNISTINIIPPGAASSFNTTTTKASSAFGTSPGGKGEGLSDDNLPAVAPRDTNVVRTSRASVAPPKTVSPCSESLSDDAAAAAVVPADEPTSGTPPPTQQEAEQGQRRPGVIADGEADGDATAAATAAATDRDVGDAEKNGTAVANNKSLPVPTTPPRFVPTQEWLDKVKADLPLNTIVRLLQHLGPQIEELVNNAEYALDEQDVLDFIKNTTMVGLLPVPHAIVIRKYQPNNFTALWFTAFMWGVIFLNNQLLPLFDGAAINLFTVSVVN